MLPEVKYPARLVVDHPCFDVAVVLATASFCFALLLADIANALMRIATALERVQVACPR
jgi:hypothetical protein